MNVIKVGINEIAYQVEGQGETLLFIHGFCGSRKYWEGITKRLAAEYRVICVDIRGHGNSSSKVYPFTIDDLAKDIKEFMEVLQLGQVYLFGHSLGGYITLSLVEHFPEKVKGYGLIHSTPYPDSEEAKNSRTEAIKSINNNGLQEFVSQLVPKLFSDENLKFLEKNVEKVKQIALSADSNAAKQLLAAMRDRPDRSHILKKAIPALLVAGRHDKIIPFNRISSINEPFLSLKLIENSGHMSMIENPIELTDAIREFLLNARKS